MIELKNITKDVPNQRILNGITCKFDKGLTFIIGDSGAGKSTLMNILSTIDNATGGEICYYLGDYIFNYTPTTSKKDSTNFRSKHVGIIFQDSNLMNELSAYQNIEMALNLAGLLVEKGRIVDTLSSLGLTKEIDKPVNLLSGGERQRVAIARALSKGAEIILADEPTGNLDANNTNDVFEKLKAISQDRIVIVVSHNLEMAKKYADRIVCIKDGAIVKDVISSQPNSCKNYDYETLKNHTDVKKHISWRMAGLLAAKNIKKFKLKFLSMVLVIGISFACVASLFTLGQMMNTQVNDINYTYYDADIVNVRPHYDNTLTPQLIVMASEGVPLYENDISFFESITDFSEVIPVNTNDFFVDGINKAIDIKSVKINSFFESRIMTDDIEGGFLTTKDEIIIGNDLSIALFDGQGIGKILTIHDDYGNEVSLKVVGINHFKNVDGLYYNYVAYDSLLDLYYESFFSEIFLESRVKNTSDTTFASDSRGYLTPSFNDDTLIWGNIPSNNSEIVISVDMLNDLYFAISGEYNRFTARDILNNDEQIKRIIQMVIAENYYISANDAYEVSIVGIHDGGSTSIYVEQEWYKSISKVLPHMIQCYCANMDVAKNFDSSSISAEYAFESYYLERFATAVENNNLWRLILGSCIVLSFIVAFVLANSYARIAIAERQYEIGIIKSLGGSRKEISFLLICEQFYLGVSSGILSATMYLVALAIIPKIYNLSLDSMNIVFCTIPLLFFGIVTLCVALCYSKITVVSKTRPIDDMRKRI